MAEIRSEMKSQQNELNYHQYYNAAGIRKIINLMLIIEYINVYEGSCQEHISLRLSINLLIYIHEKYKKKKLCIEYLTHLICYVLNF